MNIIWGYLVILFSVFITLRYKPKTMDSFVMVAMSIGTGLISVSSRGYADVLTCIFMLALQLTVIICCVIQLKREFRLRRPAKHRVIRVSKESRSVDRRNTVIDELPTVTA